MKETLYFLAIRDEETDTNDVFLFTDEADMMCVMMEIEYYFPETKMSIAYK